jgi:hypothetical protein
VDPLRYVTVDPWEKDFDITFRAGVDPLRFAVLLRASPVRPIHGYPFDVYVSP